MPLYFTLIQKWVFTLDGNDKIVRVHVTTRLAFSDTVEYTFLMVF